LVKDLHHNSSWKIIWEREREVLNLKTILGGGGVRKEDKKKKQKQNKTKTKKKKKKKKTAI
jgi:hypothetical protein